jgi:hypothetical protein
MTGLDLGSGSGLSEATTKEGDMKVMLFVAHCRGQGQGNPPQDGKPKSRKASSVLGFHDGKKEATTDSSGTL